MTDAKPITGRHVLNALLAFFGVIIVANAIFITLAVKSFPGESEKKSYLQGLNYNDILMERAEQAELGWRAAVTRIEQTDGGGVIELYIGDAGGRSLSLLNVQGILKRPTHAGEDISLTFEQLGDGAYRAVVERLGPGAWDMEAQATGASGERFDFNSRIIVE